MHEISQSNAVFESAASAAERRKRVAKVARRARSLSRAARMARRLGRRGEFSSTRTESRWVLDLARRIKAGLK